MEKSLAQAPEAELETTQMHPGRIRDTSSVLQGHSATLIVARHDRLSQLDVHTDMINLQTRPGQITIPSHEYIHPYVSGQNPNGTSSFLLSIQTNTKLSLLSPVNSKYALCCSQP